jgi:hypothetical protein
MIDALGMGDGSVGMFYSCPTVSLQTIQAAVELDNFYYVEIWTHTVLGSHGLPRKPLPPVPFDYVKPELAEDP